MYLILTDIADYSNFNINFEIDYSISFNIVILASNYWN
jgi:hypothetical protein